MSQSVIKGSEEYAKLRGSYASGMFIMVEALGLHTVRVPPIKNDTGGVTISAKLYIYVLPSADMQIEPGGVGGSQDPEWTVTYKCSLSEVGKNKIRTVLGSDEYQELSSYVPKLIFTPGSAQVIPYDPNKKLVAPLSHALSIITQDDGKLLVTCAHMKADYVDILSNAGQFYVTLHYQDNSTEEFKLLKKGDVTSRSMYADTQNIFVHYNNAHPEAPIPDVDSISMLPRATLEKIMQGMGFAWPKIFGTSERITLKDGKLLPELEDMQQFVDKLEAATLGDVGSSKEWSESPTE